MWVVLALPIIGCSVASDEAAVERSALYVIGTPIADSDIASPPPEVAELSDTSGSAFALAETLVKAINANDVETMLKHRLTESEFYWIVWPGLPSNRPEVGLPWDYLWRDMNQKSGNSARFIAAKYQGTGARLMRVEFDGETSSYGSYRVHRDARCIVEMPDGLIRRLDLFGSVIEMNGRFKAYSLLVD